MRERRLDGQIYVLFQKNNKKILIKGVLCDFRLDDLRGIQHIVLPKLVQDHDKKEDSISSIIFDQISSWIGINSSSSDKNQERKDIKLIKESSSSSHLNKCMPIYCSQHTYDNIKVI